MASSDGDRCTRNKFELTRTTYVAGTEFNIRAAELNNILATYWSSREATPEKLPPRLIQD